MRGINSFKSKYKAIVLFVILFTASSISLGFSAGNFSFRPAEAGFKVLSIFQKGFSGIEQFFSNIINSVSELNNLKDAHDELKSIISDYENLQTDLEKLQLENNRLKAELKFSESIKYSYIPAEVIAKDPTNSYQGFVIDKGSLHGVEKGMTVISFNNNKEGLVGRVIKTAPFTAQILPIVSKECFVSSRLMTSRYQGLVSGNSNEKDTLLMDYVKKKARREIQYGDLVVTSGLNSLYPKDIYIGQLITINSIEWETSLTLEIEPIVDFSKLEYVYILKEKEANSE